MRLSRRTFLLSSAAAGVGAATTVIPLTASAAPSPKPLRDDPFTLGVASGDPAPDGFVLWTRLAVTPLAADGRGGMPNRSIPVRWEVATDPKFRRVLRRGAVTARPESAHSVHVELAGLPADREYYYRFRAERYLSRIGRTRTTPPRGAPGGMLTLAFASCSHFEHGWFTAYRRLAEDRPDLVLHLGDYLYEYARDRKPLPGSPRHHAGRETKTLAQYRRRHAQYKTDPDLQAAHAAAPWAVLFDDHEVDDNYADEVPNKPESNFLKRRAAAFQAYYENMPLRRAARPKGPDMRLYRRLHWGRLATFHLLDTRQYRSDQTCGDGMKECPAAFAPTRTIIGGAQQRWLLDGFRASAARWDLLAQQVFFGRRDLDPGPAEVVWQDAWDGYPASRERVSRGWVEAGVRNAVVLTGDVHEHWAGELTRDPRNPDSPRIGTELVCSSISSGGDGMEADPLTRPWLGLNPNLRFHNSRRGYVRARITPDTLTADFRVLPYVTRRGAPARTRATFVIEDRVPVLHQTSDRP